MILAGALLLLQAQDAQALAPLNAGEWITQDDYPPVALRLEEQGAVAFDLTVSADGQVSNCATTQSSGSVVLDETTCQLVSERARFRPAKDASGTQIPAHYRGRVRWAIPKGDVQPMPIEPRLKSARLLVGADGAIKACHAVTGTDSDAVCKQLLETGLPRGLAPLTVLAKTRAPIVIIAGSGVEFDEAATVSMGREPEGTIRHALAVATFDIDANGDVRHCVETVRAGSVGLPRNLCEELPQHFVTSVPHKGRYWAKVSTGAPGPEDRP